MNKSPACPVPFRISTRDSLKCRLRRRAPLLVWLGVLAAALPLYLRQESGLTVTGVAEEIRYSVASESAGRLQRLAVTLNEDVSRGQIVAIFETDGLRLQLQAAQAELERLAHELVREQTRWEFDAAGQEAEQLTNLRRFAPRCLEHPPGAPRRPGRSGGKPYQPAGPGAQPGPVAPARGERPDLRGGVGRGPHRL
ncbi:MAG: biotin/lipoyl-binding protein [bacterium]|nr:biotin/lipoyl-binding protein [bacterium]